MVVIAVHTLLLLNKQEIADRVIISTRIFISAWPEKRFHCLDIGEIECLIVIHFFCVFDYIQFAYLFANGLSIRSFALSIFSLKMF